ncbi:hypothetical protein Q7P37_011106 [Cladosporium fusiforme]
MHEQPPVDNMLVVLGATGNQGGAVLRNFATQPYGVKYKLRGVTRNLRSTAAQSLQAMGIDMVEADLDDLASVQAAFSGATHIFATTDSNQNIFHAIQHPEVLEDDQTPRSYAREKELIQGKYIAEAASMTAGLKRIVWSSLPSPKKWSDGLYTKVTMFDTKEEIDDLMRSKPQLKHKISTLLIGFYATNARNVPQLYGPRRQADGGYELALPMSGTVPVPIADLDSDMGYWVNTLFEAAPGVSMIGCTEMISWGEWLRIWAHCNGVTARYRRASVTEYARRIEGISDAVSEEFQFIEKYGFTGGNENAVYPDQVFSKAGCRFDTQALKHKSQDVTGRAYYEKVERTLRLKPNLQRRDQASVSAMIPQD